MPYTNEGCLISGSEIPICMACDMRFTNSVTAEPEESTEIKIMFSERTKQNI